MKRSTELFSACRMLTAVLGPWLLVFSCAGPVDPIKPAALPDPYLQVRYDAIRVDPSGFSGGSTLAEVRRSMGAQGTRRPLTSAERSVSKAALNPGAAVQSGGASLSVAPNPSPSYTDRDVQVFMGALEAYEWTDSSGKGIIVIVLNPRLIDPSQLSPDARGLLGKMGTEPRVIFKAVIGWQPRRLRNDPELQVKYRRINEAYGRLARGGADLNSFAASFAANVSKVSEIQGIMGTPGISRGLTDEERSRYKRDILRRAGHVMTTSGFGFALGSLDPLFDSLVIYEWIQSGKGITVYFADVNKAIEAFLPMLDQLKSASPQTAGQLGQLETTLSTLRTLFDEPILIAPALPVGWMPENPRL